MNLRTKTWMTWPGEGGKSQQAYILPNGNLQSLQSLQIKPSVKMCDCYVELYVKLYVKLYVSVKIVRIAVVAPDCSTYKKPFEREKRHNEVCDIAALSRTSNQASARTNRHIESKRGNHLCVWGI